MKMIKIVWRKKMKIGKKILTMMIIWILILAGNLTYGDNLEISNDNHNYPIYSLVRLELNNKTQEGLKAQIRIYNNTSGDWELNQALIDRVNQDLGYLENAIDGLKEAKIIDYNDTILPGELYIMLSAESLISRAAVANDTVAYVLSHSDVWWYVATFEIAHLDLAIFDLHLYEYHFGDFSSTIEFSTSGNYSVIGKPHPPLNITSILNGTFVNNTFVPSYPQRYNLTACFVIYNGTDWVPNYPFLQYFNDTINFLNSLAIFKNNNVKIKPFRSEMIKNTIDSLHYFNLTPTTPTTNLTEPEIFALVCPSMAYIKITYSPSLDKNTKGILYFTIFSILQHLWFVKAAWYWPYVSMSSNPFLFNSIFIVTFPLFVLVVFIVLLFRFRAKKPSRLT